MAQTMISIVTPSFRQPDWLGLAIASVADQESVEHEHIIQDGGTSGIEELLRSSFEPLMERGQLQLLVEKDAGMYDAINRGLAKAQGEICSYLNCDEQYLPGTFKVVVEFFAAYPDIDVLFGDVILVDADGHPLSYRRIILPNSHHIHLSHLNTSSCATFFRKSVVERGFLFDTAWKAAGDAVWVDRLLRAKVGMAVLPRALSVFTFTGDNLGASEVSRTESARLKDKSSGKSGPRATAAVVLQHRLRKLFAGAYWPRRVKIEVYTLSSPNERKQFSRSVGFGWPGA
jgi:glycosyltransferase involved in cell wall biosynthesis